MNEEKEMIKNEIETKKDSSQVANLVVPKNIKSIVTKEQFASVEYRIGD